MADFQKIMENAAIIPKLLEIFLFEIGLDTKLHYGNSYRPMHARLVNIGHCQL